MDFHWYWYRILKFWYRDNPTRDHRRPASPGISPSKSAQVATPVAVNNVLSCSLVWMEINGQLWAIFMDGEWIGGQGCEVLLLLPGALDVVRNGKPHLACHRTAWQLQIGLFVLISVVSHVLRLTSSHLGHIAQGYYRRFFIYVSGLVPCNYCEILLSVFVSCSQNRMMWKNEDSFLLGNLSLGAWGEGGFEKEKRGLFVCSCRFCKISNRQIMWLSNALCHLKLQ